MIEIFAKHQQYLSRLREPKSIISEVKQTFERQMKQIDTQSLSRSQLIQQNAEWLKDWKGVVDIAYDFMQQHESLVKQLGDMVSSDENVEIVKRDIHIEQLQSQLAEAQAQAGKLAKENEEMQHIIYTGHKQGTIPETPYTRARELTRELTKQFFNLGMDQSLNQQIKCLERDLNMKDKEIQVLVKRIRTNNIKEKEFSAAMKEKTVLEQERNNLQQKLSQSETMIQELDKKLKQKPKKVQPKTKTYMPQIRPHWRMNKSTGTQTSLVESSAMSNIPQYVGQVVQELEPIETQENHTERLAEGTCIEELQSTSVGTPQSLARLSQASQTNLYEVDIDKAELSKVSIEPITIISRIPLASPSQVPQDEKEVTRSHPYVSQKTATLPQGEQMVRQTRNRAVTEHAPSQFTRISENAIYEEIRPRSVKDIVSQLDRFYGNQRQTSEAPSEQPNSEAFEKPILKQKRPPKNHKYKF